MDMKSKQKRSPSRRRKKFDPRKLAFFIIFIAVLVIAVSVAFFFHEKLSSGEKSILTESTLKNSVNIAELSTAEFTYNGIAQEFADADKEKVLYSIRYNAVVKAGINMSDIDIQINHEEKTITPILPEIKITATILGENKLAFIPDDVDIDLRMAMEKCEEDVLLEAEESGELYEIAKENLRTTIEALTYPIIQTQGYAIEWE